MQQKKLMIFFFVKNADVNDIKRTINYADNFTFFIPLI